MYMYDICIHIILPTFLRANVELCLCGVDFSPWNLRTHAILIVPIRDLEDIFFIFPVVIRRGHDKVMDSQSDFHRLRCRALRAVVLIVPISSDDGLNNHCQFWREVLKICAKIGKIHGVGAKIGLIGAKIHYSFCLPVMSASILLQDTKGLAWCYGVWHNFVHVKQKLARNLAKFHEFAPK